MTPVLVGGLVGLGVSIVGYLLLATADSQRVHTLGAYFFHGWSMRERLVTLSQFSSSMSLATVVIALIQLGAVFGLALSWATLTFCIGWLAFTIVVPTVRARTLPRDTIHSFLGRAYQSRAVRTVSSTATILGFLGLFATELFATDILFAALGVPSELAFPAIICFALVTILYAAAGGFRSVVRSDWSQAALLFAALVILVLLATKAFMAQPQRSMTDLRVVAGALPLTVAISLFFINALYPFVDTQAWQRARAAAADRDARSGTAKASLLFALSWTVLIVLGAVTRIGPQDGQDPFVGLIGGTADLSSPLAFLAGLVLLPGLSAAMFSSADGFINSAAHVFSLDLSSVGDRDEAADVTSTARRHVVMLGLLGLAGCLFLRSVGFGIIDMVFAVSAGQIALLPSVAFALGGRASRALRGAAIASVVAGFGAAWVNGLYSTMMAGASLGSDAGLWSDLLALFPPDVYRSPTYAFVASTITFMVGAVLSLVTRGAAEDDSDI